MNEARKAVNITYARKITGLPLIGQSARSYQGSFDVHAFVTAQRVPDHHGLSVHQRYWQDMWRNFQVAWQAQI